MGRKKLADRHQHQVCRWLAEWMDPKEIQKHLKADYKITIGLNSIKAYEDSDKWLPIIRKYRKEYCDRIKDVPIANKRVRFEILHRMAFDKNKTLALKALQQARLEAEGVQVHLTLDELRNNFVKAMGLDELADDD